MTSLLGKVIVLLLISAVKPRSLNEGPFEQSGTFSISDINNTAVCILSKQVYRDGEIMKFPDPCEICRCRPPGIACATLQCKKLVPRVNCRITKEENACCPEMICDEAEADVHRASSDLPEESTKSNFEPTSTLNPFHEDETVTPTVNEDSTVTEPEIIGEESKTQKKLEGSPSKVQPATIKDEATSERPSKSNSSDEEELRNETSTIDALKNSTSDDDESDFGSSHNATGILSECKQVTCRK